MTPQDDIINAHPNHFPGPRYIECKGGWNKLILAFIEELDKIPGGRDMRFFCIKEKFGRLRFDFEEYDSEQMLMLVSDLEDKYQKKSEETCEECGQPGSIRTVGGWIRTVCNQHS